MKRIKSSREIEYFFKNGIWYNSPFVKILVLDKTMERDRFGRVAFIAGKKIGSAVKRSRAKRLLRESAKDCLPVSHHDIIVIATHKTPYASLNEVKRSLIQVLDKAGIR